MRVLDICLKDVVQVLRDRKSLLFLVAMPLVFTLFMGFAFRSGAQGEAEAMRLRLGWVNEDVGGELSIALYDSLATDPAIVVVDLEADGRLAGAAEADGWMEAAQQVVRAGKMAGVLLVPAGYSQRDGRAGGSRVTLIADRNTPEGRTLAQAVQGPITRVQSAAEIARLAAEAGGADSYEPALRDALASWARHNTAPLISTRGERDAEALWYGDNPYNMASPGILVQFAIMTLVGSANILLAERKARTLQRMITTSLARWQILLGHALGMLGVTMLQIMLLVAFGQAVLGVQYLRAPLATLVASLGLSLWVAGLGLTIGVLARDDSQVVLFALLAMFVLSALGGTWFPLDLVGGAYAAIGRALPSGLAMTAYQNVLMRGLGTASVLVPVLGMVGWALALGTVVWLLFRGAKA